MLITVNTATVQSSACDHFSLVPQFFTCHPSGLHLWLQDYLDTTFCLYPRVSNPCLLWICLPSSVGTHQLLTSHQLIINRNGPPSMLLLDVALLSSSVDGQLLPSLILEHAIQNHQSHENVQLPLFAILIVYSFSSLSLIVL